METYNKIATNQIILKSNFVLTPMQKINARTKARTKFEEIRFSNEVLTKDVIYDCRLSEYGIDYLLPTYETRYKDLLKSLGQYKEVAQRNYEGHVDGIDI